MTTVSIVEHFAVRENKHLSYIFVYVCVQFRGKWDAKDMGR